MENLIIRIRCSKCKAERNTSSLKKAKCFVCNYNSVIFNVRKNTSRLVKIVKGNEILLSKRLYQEGIFKKKRWYDGIREMH